MVPKVFEPLKFDCIIILSAVLYFFGFKQDFFQKQYSEIYSHLFKTDLDFWDCLRRENHITIQGFITLIKIFGVILRVEKHHFIAR